MELTQVGPSAALIRKVKQSDWSADCYKRDVIKAIRMCLIDWIVDADDEPIVMNGMSSGSSYGGLRLLEPSGKVSDPREDAWLSSVEAELDSLRSLPADWEEGRGASIKPELIEKARQFLRSIANTAPRPHIGPTVLGGIQIEWHRNDHDLEILIEPNTPQYVFFQRAPFAVLHDGELNDFNRLKSFLQVVSK